MPQVAKPPRPTAGRPAAIPGQRLVSRGISLPAALWARLGAEAAERGIALGTLVRERLGGGRAKPPLPVD